MRCIVCTFPVLGLKDNNYNNKKQGIERRVPEIQRGMNTAGKKTSMCNHKKQGVNSDTNETSWRWVSGRKGRKSACHAGCGHASFKQKRMRKVTSWGKSQVFYLLE